MSPRKREMTFIVTRSGLAREVGARKHRKLIIREDFTSCYLLSRASGKCACNGAWPTNGLLLKVVQHQYVAHSALACSSPQFVPHVRPE